MIGTKDSRQGMRYFNTEGPIEAEDHYNIPPLDRLDLDDVLGLVRKKKYFILHAPRQSGKTSALLALQDLLNSGAAGDYRCVYVNVEAGQAGREDTQRAMRAILAALALRAEVSLDDSFVTGTMGKALDEFGPDGALVATLRRWAQADARPLVLLVDETDALVGDTLLSVLRQLRSGYDLRPRSFPQSVVLCGVRDLRDYRIRSGSTGEAVTGGSAFNISAKSMRLGGFTREEVAKLLGQHTDETGQSFEPAAFDLVWGRTQGQPWLVNAVCQHACFETEWGRDRGREIAGEDILEAQEELILRRVVHLDQLADKLREDRVRRVVEPLLSGASQQNLSERDLEYVRDLGLVARDAPLRIANPIYAEVVPRELTYVTQETLLEEMAWYVDPGGGLDMGKLLAAFQEFYREHSEHWLERYQYKEAGPQLLLQAFLQRVVNGGGRIEREYGLGRGRTDLLVQWPRGERTQRFVVECKVLRSGLESTIRKGLEQTAWYMDRCGAEAGHLVLFDRSGRRWAQKVFHRKETFGEKAIEIWGS